MIQYARDLVRRELLQEYPCSLAELRIIACREVPDKKRAVISNLALLKVPGRQVPIEERIALQSAGVQRREFLKLPVRCHQERVENLHTNILLRCLCHHNTSLSFRVHHLTTTCLSSGIQVEMKKDK